MKTGQSSLNPNAASYVPLFKRGTADVNREFSSAKEDNETAQFGHQPDDAWKGHASTSHPNMVPEKSYFDDYDMDLAYLRMTFPGISEESLSDVYLANICDLDAAIEMIHELEIHPDDLPTKLPDTLDIGDVPETGSTSELKEQKVRNATSEAGTSTSL